MNVVLQSNERSLLSLSTDELRGLTGALNEVCNGAGTPKEAFLERVGVNRETLLSLLGILRSHPHQSRRAQELVQVWAEHGSVMVRAISVYGDPVELGETQSTEFLAQLKLAIKEAS
jgi:hypothetical protein